ncbi:hypothetical protein ACFSQJ_03505 [Croceitalea marina]|uniref:Uncharacterized protein n=1 Tax=Croceitalea marina TaxID=1775166 RepID=A0ABW5MU43_9FLAO
MNFYKIILGVFIVIGSVWYFSHLRKNNLEDEDKSPIEKSFDIEIYFGLMIIFVIGLVMIYRELFQ